MPWESAGARLRRVRTPMRRSSKTVLNYLKFAGLPTLSATTTVQNLTDSTKDVSQATQMDKLKVTVTLPIQCRALCAGPVGDQ